MKAISKNIGKNFYLFYDDDSVDNAVIVQCGLEGGVSIRKEGMRIYAIKVDGVDEI